MEFIEESNVQPIDTAWRCSQGICFLKAWSQEEWWQKLLSEETFTYFSIHSYCDFLTKYWNFTSPGESFVCPGWQIFHPCKVVSGTNLPWGCTWEGWAWERAEGSEQCQGMGHPKNSWEVCFVCLLWPEEEVGVWKESELFHQKWFSWEPCLQPISYVCLILSGVCKLLYIIPNNAKSTCQG